MGIFDIFRKKKNDVIEDNERDEIIVKRYTSCEPFVIEIINELTKGTENENIIWQKTNTGLAYSTNINGNIFDLQDLYPGVIFSVTKEGNNFPFIIESGRESYIIEDRVERIDDLNERLKLLKNLIYHQVLKRDEGRINNLLNDLRKINVKNKENKTNGFIR